MLKPLNSWRARYSKLLRSHRSMTQPGLPVLDNHATLQHKDHLVMVIGTKVGSRRVTRCCQSCHKQQHIITLPVTFDMSSQINKTQHVATLLVVEGGWRGVTAGDQTPVFARGYRCCLLSCRFYFSRRLHHAVYPYSSIRSITLKPYRATSNQSTQECKHNLKHSQNNLNLKYNIFS